MKPDQVVAKLRQIATAIENSENPNKVAVTQDIKSVLAAVQEGNKYEVCCIDENSDGWGDIEEMTSIETDPEKVKNDLNIQWEKAVNDLYDSTMGSEAQLGPAEAVNELSEIVAFADPEEEMEGFPLPISGPGWVAKGKYGNLDTMMAWKRAD